MALTSPFPYDTPYAPEITDRHTGRKTRSPFLSQELVDWLLEQQSRTQSAPSVNGSVTLTAQAASIGATPVPMPDLTAGSYLVSVFARITTAAVTSSSLTIVIGFTSGGISCSLPIAAMTGNTTATVNVPFVALVNSDANAPITYTVTYASNGAGEMKYTLTVIVAAVPT